MSNEAEQIKNLLLRRKADLCSGGLLDLLLIGSVATGERCNRVGHSDIDILAIYDDTVAAIDSAQRTAALRTLIALDPHVHVGIRWRKVSELDAFFRHLSLFGFHRGNVLPLLCSGHFELKAVDNRAPAADEALCVLAECLWSEIRLRELVPRSVGERLYIDSKLALAYLNLLLVQQRIFLPLHAVRVQRWEALNLTGGIDLDAVLAGKFGSAPNTAASACAAAVGVLRKQVYHAATALEGCA